MKRTLTILLFMIMSLPCCPMTLQGGVTYTVETARKEAFDGVVYQIPVSTFSKYLTDPNYAANKKAMKSGQTDLGDRWIAFFSDGSYYVVYKNDRYKTLTYTPEGKLESIGIRSGLSIPLKTYKYSNDGKLEHIAFTISDNEIFIYSVNGKLECHWINDKSYDENGELIIKQIK